MAYSPAEPDRYGPIQLPEQEKLSLLDAAREMFGFEHLLPGQAEIMHCVARGEDVLAILPTGGGKSLTYQLPSLRDTTGCTLVISPLIALMKDQVDKLPRGVSHLATAINSSLEGDELHRRLEGVERGMYRLVYVAPERLRQPSFVQGMRRGGINRLVIDEAHCVSMWGHDFRPDYLHIAESRRLLGQPPLLALTATAPPGVRNDILQRLGPMRVVSGEVLRSNLRFEVIQLRNQDEKLQSLLDICSHEPGAGIVYAGTRARCEELASLLRSQGVTAIHYHAGIEDRARAQEEFMSGRARVIVATIAFGMGIDKPDIRLVLHFEPSSSLESYYQEAGRAGRDGLPSRCVLLYARADQGTLRARSKRDALGVKLLRGTLAAIKKQVEPATVGRVVLDDLRRDLQVDETPVRVAISLLEQAGLIRRGPDIPRCLTLWMARPLGTTDRDLESFCRACGLQPRQRVECDPLEVARVAGLDPATIEERVWNGCASGGLSCRASARDMLLELRQTPRDAQERIDALLDQYEQVREQRVNEMVAYANTRHCRHGHICTYLSGYGPQRCKACDNCVPRPVAPRIDLMAEWEQMLVILRVAGRGWGRRKLIFVLRGDAAAPAFALDRPGFGALAFRSEPALEYLIDRLLAAGFLQARRLEHGGVALRLTPSGTRALQHPEAVRALTEAPTTCHTAEPTHTLDAEWSEDAEALYQRLRQWRLERARAKGLPAFMIAHDALLRRIAAAHPRSGQALSQIGGIGPHKLQEYGTELLALINQ